MQPYDERLDNFLNGQKDHELTAGEVRRILLLGRNTHYKWAAKIIKKNSVLDVGAGLCDLKKYLDPDAAYTGIDATQRVCNVSDAIFADVMEYNNQEQYVCGFGIFETSSNPEALAEQLKSLCTVAVLASFNKCTAEPESFSAYTNQQMLAYFPGATIIESQSDREPNLLIWEKPQS